MAHPAGLGGSLKLIIEFAISVLGIEERWMHQLNTIALQDLKIAELHPWLSHPHNINYQVK